MPHRSRRCRFVSALVAATLAVGCRAEGSKLPVVGLMQVASFAALDDARDGYLRALADSGFVDGRTVRLIRRNAQGDVPALQLIAQEFAREPVDLIAALSTPATQAAMKATRTVPIVFGAVANPYVIGAGESPTRHRPNVTGAPIPLPVDSAIMIVHRVMPKVKTLGTLFDPADAFAEFYLDMARGTARRLGLNLVEVPVTGSAEVVSAVQALGPRGVEVLMQIPSVLVYSTIDAVLRAAARQQLPVVLNDPGVLGRGAVAAIGISFYDNGYSAGALAARVLHGERPADIPFPEAGRMRLVLDLGAARRYRIAIPPDLLARADSVLGR